MNEQGPNNLSQPTKNHDRSAIVRVFIGEQGLRSGWRLFLYIVAVVQVAGIILAYPDLQLKIDGYTDSVGGEQYNQQLSEERAASVRDYLISQGVSANNVIAQGFGKNDPIASNASPEGRQQNRRVEMLVSGNAIGASGSSGATSGTQEGAIASPTQQNRPQ